MLQPCLNDVIHTLLLSHQLKFLQYTFNLFGYVSFSLTVLFYCRDTFDMSEIWELSIVRPLLNVTTLKSFNFLC